MLHYPSRRLRWAALAWALALALVPVAAHAEPETGGSVVDPSPYLGSDESVQEPVVLDSETVQEMINLAAESAASDDEDAPVVLYDSDGTRALTSESPAEPSGVAAFAVSGSVYGSVTPGTYSELASAIVSKSVTPTDHYVFARTSDDEYVLAYGDLSLSGTTFSGSSCSVVSFYRSNNYGNYLVDFSTENVSLNVGSYIVMSDLGQYPQLDVQESKTGLYMLCGLGVALAMWAISGLFRTVLRERG